MKNIHVDVYVEFDIRVTNKYHHKGKVFSSWEYLAIFCLHC